MRQGVTTTLSSGTQLYQKQKLTQDFDKLRTVLGKLRTIPIRTHAHDLYQFVCLQIYSNLIGKTKPRQAMVTMLG